MTPRSTPPRFLGPRMVAIATLAMNVATGLTFGSFGALVLPIAARFGAAKSVVSLDIALVVLTHAVIGPFIPALARRFSIRALMITGALLNAAGYAALACAGDTVQMLLLFGLLIGPGGALMGTLPAFMLVSNWYNRGQGRALGLVSMPLLVMVAPLAIVWLQPVFGLSGAVLALAAGFLLATPAFFFVVDRPETVGQTSLGEGLIHPGGEAQTTRDASLLRDPIFLLLTLATGLAMGAAISKSVHFMPMLVERGIDTKFAALLLALSGGSGIAGALLFGYLTDRFNAAAVLMGNVLVQGLIWTIPLFTTNPAALLVDAVAIGVCGGGYTNAQAVLSKRLFGNAGLGKALGFTSLLTLPFFFGINPVAGLLRDWTGNYTLTILTQSAGFGVAALCFLYIARREQMLRPMALGEASAAG